MDREKWISDRAYFLWEFRQKLGCPSLPEDNWFDAEWEWEQLRKHALEFIEEYRLC